MRLLGKIDPVILGPIRASESSGDIDADVGAVTARVSEELTVVLASGEAVAGFWAVVESVLVVSLVGFDWQPPSAISALAIKNL